MTNVKEMAELIQKSSDGKLTAIQSAGIAAKFKAEVETYGTVSETDAKSILAKHVKDELKEPQIVQVSRTPNWADDALKTPAEKEEDKREDIMWKARDVISVQRGSQTTFQTDDSPLEELKAEVQTYPLDKVKQELNRSNFKLTTCKNFENLVKTRVEESVGGLLPKGGNVNFSADVAQRRREAFERFMEQRKEDIETAEKAIPYFEEIVAVFRDRLNEIEKLQTEQAKKVPQILKNMKKTADAANRLVAETEKLLPEYQKPTQRKEDRNLLERLASIARKHQELTTQYQSFKDELSLLSMQPEFPLMHDLPILPQKVWHIALMS